MRKKLDADWLRAYRTRRDQQLIYFDRGLAHCIIHYEHSDYFFNGEHSRRQNVCRLLSILSCWMDHSTFIIQAAQFFFLPFFFTKENTQGSRAFTTRSLESFYVSFENYFVYNFFFYPQASSLMNWTLEEHVLYLKFRDTRFSVILARCYSLFTRDEGL